MVAVKSAGTTTSSASGADAMRGSEMRKIWAVMGLVFATAAFGAERQALRVKPADEPQVSAVSEKEARSGVDEHGAWCSVPAKVLCGACSVVCSIGRAATCTLGVETSRSSFPRSCVKEPECKCTGPAEQAAEKRQVKSP